MSGIILDGANQTISEVVSKETLKIINEMPYDSNLAPNHHGKGIQRVKSLNEIGRRVTMKTQGGGFNRTQSSGYFKSKDKVVENNRKMISQTS